MAEVTYYVAMPFIMGDDSPMPVEATECQSANAAVMRADSLARKSDHVGALAFSRTGDPMLGEFSDAVLIRSYGDVPTDLSGL